MAAHKAITPKIVKKAIAKTGLVPLNPAVFNDRDFVPSLAATQATQAQALEIISNEIEQLEMDVMRQHWHWTTEAWIKMMNWNLPFLEIGRAHV